MSDCLVPKAFLDVVNVDVSLSPRVVSEANTFLAAHRVSADPPSWARTKLFSTARSATVSPLISARLQTELEFQSGSLVSDPKHFLSIHRLAFATHGLPSYLNLFLCVGRSTTQTGALAPNEPERVAGWYWRTLAVWPPPSIAVV